MDGVFVGRLSDQALELRGEILGRGEPDRMGDGRDGPSGKKFLRPFDALAEKVGVGRVAGLKPEEGDQRVGGEVAVSRQTRQRITLFGMALHLLDQGLNPVVDSRPTWGFCRRQDGHHKVESGHA